MDFRSNVRALLASVMIAFILWLFGCTTSLKNQSEQGKPEKNHQLADRRLAQELGADPLEGSDILIKRVVSNSALGISGECRIFKGSRVEIVNGEHKNKKNIHSTLIDGKRPDSRAGGGKNRNRERSEWQLGKGFSEKEVEELLSKSMGGKLQIVHEGDKSKEENYSEIEITGWGQTANGTRGPQVISRQDENGSQSVNDRLNSSEVTVIADLTKSICH